MSNKYCINKTYRRKTKWSLNYLFFRSLHNFIPLRVVSIYFNIAVGYDINNSLGFFNPVQNILLLSSKQCVIEYSKSQVKFACSKKSFFFFIFCNIKYVIHKISSKHKIFSAFDHIIEL